MNPPPTTNHSAILSQSLHLKSEGNNHFSSHNYPAAEATYRHALRVLSSLPPPSSTTEEPNTNTNANSPLSLKTALTSNLSLVLLRLERYEDAERVCTALLSSLPSPSSSSSTSPTVGMSKLYYRRAQARQSLERWDGAEEDLVVCLSLLRGGGGAGGAGGRRKEVQDTESLLRRVRSGRLLQQQKEEEEGKDGNGEEEGKVSPPGLPTAVPPYNTDSNATASTATTSTSSATSATNTSTTTPTVEETKKDNGGGSNGTSTNINPTTIPPPTPTPPPPTTTQLQITTTLLSQSPHYSLPNEAFFLIDYAWWTHWCRHVNFFADIEFTRIRDGLESQAEAEASSNTGGEATQWKEAMSKLQTIRRTKRLLLPSGGTIPIQPDSQKRIRLKRRRRRKKRALERRARRSKFKSSNSRYQSSSSSELSTSSSSSSDGEEGEGEEGRGYGPPPGPINNTALILPPTPSLTGVPTWEDRSGDRYLREWRYPFDSPPSPSAKLPNGGEKKGGGEGDGGEGGGVENEEPIRIRSHLIRSHHYEILPREVYAALRCWYGEITPSIVRRSGPIPNNDTTTHPSTTTTTRLAVHLYPNPQPPTHPSPNFQQGGGGGKNGEWHLCAACKSPHARSRCTRCSNTYYCNRSCQASHWPYHKLHCPSPSPCPTIPNTLTPPSPLTTEPHWGRTGLHNLGNTCFLNSALQCLSHASPLTHHFLTDRWKQDLNEENPLGSGGELARAYAGVISDLWMGRGASGWGGRAAPVRPVGLKRAVARVNDQFADAGQHDAHEFLATLIDGLHEDLNVVEYRRVEGGGDGEEEESVEEEEGEVAGIKAWELFSSRNRSCVMDTFYGQFRSTCVCPNCHKRSVSWEIFKEISLEIPQIAPSSSSVAPLVPVPRGDSMGGGMDPTRRMIPVVFFRSVPESCKTTDIEENGGGAPSPQRYGVDLPRNGTIGHLRRALSCLTGIEASRTMVCDVYENSIYDFLPDDRLLDRVGRDDVVVGYELDQMDEGKKKGEEEGKVVEDEMMGGKEVDGGGFGTMHAVVTHEEQVMVDEDDMEEEETIGYALSGGGNGGRNKKEYLVHESFGYPLLTTIRLEWTCGQLWEYLWRQVAHLILWGDEDDDNDGMYGAADDQEIDDVDMEARRKQRHKSLIQIRAMDGNNQPCPLFCGATLPNPNRITTATATSQTPSLEQVDDHSILPRISNHQSLSSFLSNNTNESYTANSYILFRIEYLNPPPYSRQPLNFLEPSDHLSYTTSITRQRVWAQQQRHIQQQQLLQQQQQSQQKRTTTTLHHCLSKFIRPECLDEDNQWYCSRCKDRVRARKTMEIWRLPNVLVVHLKRFEYRRVGRMGGIGGGGFGPTVGGYGGIQGFGGGGRDKLETYVEFPTEGLDMGKYCASMEGYRPETEDEDCNGSKGGGGGEESFVIPDVPAIYDLFAVTNHYGRMGFGHYTAVARRWNGREMENDWAAFDDTSVERTSTTGGGDDVVSSAAYILFYRRRVFS